MMSKKPQKKNNTNTKKPHARTHGSELRNLGVGERDKDALDVALHLRAPALKVGQHVGVGHRNNIGRMLAVLRKLKCVAGVGAF
jgi:hypothetical protein